MSFPAMTATTTEKKAIKRLTTQEMLIAVMNEIIARNGNITVQVTRYRQNSCIPHDVKTSETYSPETVFRNPNGIWVMKVGIKWCSPQMKTTNFEEWITKEYRKIKNSNNKERTEQPPGEFTCWS